MFSSLLRCSAIGSLVRPHSELAAPTVSLLKLYCSPLMMRSSDTLYVGCFAQGRHVRPTDSFASRNRRHVFKLQRYTPPALVCIAENECSGDGLCELRSIDAGRNRGDCYLDAI
ncbi:hypothetical protein EVAR_19484_1 [Eumeta japonica]|uniref:Uncharacterized protein n=1 Tax=Eumeta variegata TaxID=151549 RepID=A0A4C1V935_EUMVA|nr:hypothetical protein EVAR_19484_1 [Eumeta japonica]